MTMALRLSEEEARALRRYAHEHGLSTHDAAREAVRQLIHNDRRETVSRMLRERDRELLDRLGPGPALPGRWWAGRIRDLARRGRL
jgi:hypothetical protein